jgi:ribonuclease-3
MGSVEYAVQGSGPDHARTFVATLRIGGTAYGEGTGHSKKEAEQEAAAVSWRQLRSVEPADA